MPVQGKDGKYRPLGYTGEPMNKKEYDMWKEKKGMQYKKIKKAWTPKFDARKRSKRK